MPECCENLHKSQRLTDWEKKTRSGLKHRSGGCSFVRKKSYARQAGLSCGLFFWQRSLVIASKNNHYGRTECSMGRGNGGCLLKTRKIHNVSYIFPGRMEGSHLTWGSWVPRVQLNLSPASYDPAGSNRLQVKEGAQ